MSLLDTAPEWVLWGYAALLLLAAAQDAWQLKISNYLCGALLLLALVAAGLVGPQWAMWQNLAGFALALAAGTVLFARGIMGGGDVKLFAVAVLWFDLPDAFKLLLAMAISGGVLAVLVIALRQLPWRDGARARVAMLKPRGGIPYGVAIAAGGLIALL